VSDGDRRPRLVSVVVPVRDERRHLREQLDAVAAQDYPGDWELVVSDDGSRDGSAELASAWTRERALGRVVARSPGRGPGAARNVGAREASGDLLAFCDADDVVCTDWLRALVAAAAGADLVGGGEEAARLNDERSRECFGVHDPTAPFHDYLPRASGSNFGIWRDVFDALGGFDEGSLTGEDVALTWRAHQAGYRYAAAPEAVVHKRFATGLLDTALQYFAYGQGDAWLFRRFRADGMARRSRRDTYVLYRHLVGRSTVLFRGPPVDRCRWVALAAVSSGRLVGSARYRVLFP
jgi:glycosyltransferase involved in cell wall biosynthesis